MPSYGGPAPPRRQRPRGSRGGSPAAWIWGAGGSPAGQRGRIRTPAVSVMRSPFSHDLARGPRRTRRAEARHGARDPRAGPRPAEDPAPGPSLPGGRPCSRLPAPRSRSARRARAAAGGKAGGRQSGRAVMAGGGFGIGGRAQDPRQMRGGDIGHVAKRDQQTGGRARRSQAGAQAVRLLPRRDRSRSGSRPDAAKASFEITAIR